MSDDAVTVLLSHLDLSKSAANNHLHQLLIITSQYKVVHVHVSVNLVHLTRRCAKFSSHNHSNFCLRISRPTEIMIKEYTTLQKDQFYEVALFEWTASLLKGGKVKSVRQSDCWNSFGSEPGGLHLNAGDGRRMDEPSWQ
ncbi:hypothetical protein T12_7216 [Trichinella patagoniensis]|uniref:Uncharacterized protein n=1 Tax=Trichinella patagoniensis TaxID=990121 RepID=A0A0V0ZWA1_9BILA|nr:hypothetical protein T12_7216 [Trichinella patagoniensis]